MEDIDKIKRIEVFDLELPSELDKYERLLNSSEWEITDEKFAYVGRGLAKVTVWFEKDKD